MNTRHMFAFTIAFVMLCAFSSAYSQTFRDNYSKRQKDLLTEIKRATGAGEITEAEREVLAGEQRDIARKYQAFLANDEKIDSTEEEILNALMDRAEERIEQMKTNATDVQNPGKL